MERARAEAGRWTDDRRRLFHEVNDAAHEWAYLLRRAARQPSAAGPDPTAPSIDTVRLNAVERRFHGLVFEAALIATANVQDAIEAVEHMFWRLTNELGYATEYGAGAPPDAARQAGLRWATGDHPELRAVRVHMRDAMRAELGMPS